MAKKEVQRPANNSNQFKKKVLIVTGASSGIGKATALAFAQAGGQVAVVDVLEKEGLNTAKMIEKAGGKAQFIKCDVSKEDDVKKMISQTIKTFGQIDYAFNNAGIEGQTAPTAESSMENWNRVIDINLKGVWLCMKYELIQMLKQGHGGIINCSSIAGLVAFEGIPAYVASKHGVLGLTKTAAMEYAKSNIRINAICPGVIKTPMIDRFIKGDKDFEKGLLEGEPVGRMGRPEEIASAVLFLCSEGSSFVTGHPLVVDGGWVAR